MIYIFGISLVYILLISIIYFSKKRIDNYDNKIYSVIILVNIVGIIIDVTQWSLIKIEASNLVISIVGKMFLSYVTCWTFLFCSYILSLGINSNLNKKLRKIRYIPLIISVLGIFLFPISYFYDGHDMYTYGTPVNLTYIVVCLYIVIMIISCFQLVEK